MSPQTLDQASYIIGGIGVTFAVIFGVAYLSLGLSHVHLPKRSATVLVLIGSVICLVGFIVILGAASGHWPRWLARFAAALPGLVITIQFFAAWRQKKLISSAAQS